MLRAGLITKYYQIGMEYDRVLPAGVLRVLVACEYSGLVREAFKALGHDAMSCDLLDTEIPGIAL